MTTYGITPEGFVIKPISVIKSELENDYQSVYGSDFNIEPSSPMGQDIQSKAIQISALWEALEAVYNGFNPNAVQNATQDNLVAINGIRRQEATSTRVLNVDLTGTALTVIPAGSIVSDSVTLQNYTLDAEVTLDASGDGIGNFTATVTGPIQCLPLNLDTIESPVFGWDTVSNTNSGVTGQNRETDTELRTRRAASVSRASEPQVEALRADLLAVDGVEYVEIDNNTTDLENANGTPAHAFQPVVLGGTDQDVANVIASKEIFGIESDGNIGTPPIYTYTNGTTREVKFSRPTEISIYVDVDYSLLPGFGPLTVEQQDALKQDIVDFGRANFTVGQLVVRTQLYTPVNLTPGISIVEIRIGTSPATATSDVTIAFDEISSWDVLNVTLTGI